MIYFFFFLGKRKLFFKNPSFRDSKTKQSGMKKQNQPPSYHYSHLNMSSGNSLVLKYYECAVGRAVASNYRGLLFESSLRQIFISYEHVFTVKCIKETKINKNRPVMAHFKHTSKKPNICSIFLDLLSLDFDGLSIASNDLNI